MTRLRNLSAEEVRKFIWVFYSVGIIGIGIPWSRNFFTCLIPLNFLVAFVVLIITDRSDLKRLLPFAVAVFVLGFIIEAFGVNTGIIFGDYSYGKSLGPKLFGTPVIIGWNWLMLVYCTTRIASGMTANRYFISFLATVLMVIYDMALESPAGILDMWNWDWSNVPMQNFLAWFIIAWIFNGALQIRRIKIENQVAGTLYTAQLLFFLFLNLVFYVEQTFSLW